MNIHFHSQDWREKILSDLARTPFTITINGEIIRCNSVEGFWQGLKCEGDMRKQVFLLSGMASVAASLSMDKSNSVVITSNEAQQRYCALLPALRMMSLAHEQIMGVFRSAKTIFTTTGLTTLLELAQLRKVVVPLPPMNRSQAHVIRNVARLWRDAPTIWRFLSDAYPVHRQQSPKECFELVRNRNAYLLRSAEFIAGYRQAALEAVDTSRHLPDTLAMNFDGVTECCRHILRVLQAS